MQIPDNFVGSQGGQGCQPGCYTFRKHAPAYFISIWNFVSGPPYKVKVGHYF